MAQGDLFIQKLRYSIIILWLYHISSESVNVESTSSSVILLWSTVDAAAGGGGFESVLACDGIRR
jgi:hypothetical protein